MTKRTQPIQALPLDQKLPLSTSDVKLWKKQGFLLVDGIVEQELAIRARERTRAVLCSNGEKKTGFGHLQFPYQPSEAALSEITLHPRMIACVKQLLEIEEIRLTQSDAWMKVGRPRPDCGHWQRFESDDQRMHVDFPNHSLVVPPPWDEPEAVAMIVYLDDESTCGGATRVVPRCGEDDEAYAYPCICSTPGVGDLPFFNDRTLAEMDLGKRSPAIASFREKLYTREVESVFHVGTVLLYRHDLWHRGTPLRDNAERITMNILFKKPFTDWFGHWNSGFARWSYRPPPEEMVAEYMPDKGLAQQNDKDDAEQADKTGRSLLAPLPKLIASLSVEQRSCLGFPEPGNKYWTSKTLEAVRRRYGPLGMDMSPYEQGLAAAPTKKRKAE